MTETPLVGSAAADQRETAAAVQGETAAADQGETAAADQGETAAADPETPAASTFSPQYVESAIPTSGTTSTTVSPFFPLLGFCFFEHFTYV